MDLFKRENENDRQFIFRLGRAKEQGLIDLDWQQLTDIFNRELTDIKNGADKLSASTYQQQYRIAVLYYEDVFKGYDTNNNNEETIGLLEEKTQTFYKEKVKAQDALREMRKHLRDEARIEALKEAIQSEAKNFHVDLKPFKVEDEILYSGNKEAVLCIGDWHIGAFANNFRNTYNIEIAQQRLKTLFSKVVYYCKIHKIAKLNVVNLSDLIEGEIHVSSRIESELDTIEQIKIASQLLSKFLIDLTSEIPFVTYRSVLDNHSRVQPNYKDHIEKESFCKLIDWWLEEKIKQANLEFEKVGMSNSIEMIQDNIDDNIGMFRVNNKTIAFSHGHLGSANSILQDLAFGTNTMIDIVLLGHWHVDKVKNFQGKKIYFNGSLKGVDSYTLNKRLFSDPSQTLLIFDNEDVIDIPMNLIC